MGNFKINGQKRARIDGQKTCTRKITTELVDWKVYSKKDEVDATQDLKEKR